MKKGLQLQFLKGVHVPTERGKAKKCTICNRDFGFLTPEHQCKRCKRAVCEKCSPFKQFTIKQKGLSKDKHRLCICCKEESDAMKKFIEQQKIRFLQDTYSLNWLKSFGYTQETATKEYDQVSCKDDVEFQKMNKEIDQVLTELFTCYNYSLKEFFFTIFQDINNVSEVIKRVLGTFLKAYPEVGYCADQVFLTLFLLCFSSEASAYTLLALIYAEVIPCQLYPTTLSHSPYDYQSEIEKTLSVLVQAFKMSVKDAPIVKKFLIDQIHLYIRTLTLNFFLFETSFFIIDQMLSQPKSSYDDLSKYLGAAFAPHVVDMKNYLSEYNQIQLLILWNIKQSIIQDGYFRTKQVNLNQIVKPFARASAIVTRQKTVIVDSPHAALEQQIQDLQEVNYRLLKENQNYKKSNQDLNIQCEAQSFQIQSLNEILKQFQAQEQKDLERLNINEDEEYQNIRRITIQDTYKEDNQEIKQYKQLIQKLEHSLILENKINEELKNNFAQLQEEYKQVIQKDQDAQKQQEVYLENLSKQNNSLLQYISELETEVKQIEILQKQNEDLKELEAKYLKLDTDYTISEQLKQSLDAANQGLYLRNKELEQTIQQINDTLDSNKNQQNDQLKLINELKETQQMYEKSENEKQELIQQIKSKQIQNDAQILQIQKLMEQIEEMQKIINHQESKLKQINEEVQQQQLKLDQAISKQEQLEAQQLEIQQLKQSNQELLIKFSSSISENEFNKLTLKLNKVKQKHKQEKQLIHQLQEQINNYQKQLIDQSEKAKIIMQLISSVSTSDYSFTDRAFSPRKSQTIDEYTMIIEVRNQQIITLKQVVQDLQEKMKNVFQQISKLL